MPSVTEFAPAKVNLTLALKGRRVDGYHELSSLVAFADVGDELAIARASEMALEVVGPFAADVPAGADNIIFKAWAALRALVPVPQVHVRLTKNLPVASGIGGGSADGAALLRGVLRLAGASLSDAQVQGFARSLGADIPVCFHGRACRMEGIGEKLGAFDAELPQALVLANPRVACSTAAVFSALGLQPGQGFDGGNNMWRNDLTAPALKAQPVIADVLRVLEGQGVSPVLMSGSGATCFGIARNFAEAEAAAVQISAQHPQWWVKAARVLP